MGLQVAFAVLFPNAEYRMSMVTHHAAPAFIRSPCAVVEAEGLFHSVIATVLSLPTEVSSHAQKIPSVNRKERGPLAGLDLSVPTLQVIEVTFGRVTHSLRGNGYCVSPLCSFCFLLES